MRRILTCVALALALAETGAAMMTTRESSPATASSMGDLHAAATTSPTTMPTTRPEAAAVRDPRAGETASARVRAPMAMPSDFAVVGIRSIFYKGHLPTSSMGSGRFRENTASATTQPESSLRHTLVFNGATDVDGIRVAFIEDTATGAIQKLRLGDSIAGGTVTRITLEELDYQANGQLAHVAIGATLDGGEAPELSMRAMPLGTGPTSGPTTGPAGSANDILEKMRQRRMRGE